ncbi:uncharacterized protein VP01_8712g2, partial [Puccinia sorghi]
WSQNQPRGTPNSCNATSTTQDPMEIEDASQSSVVIDTTPTGCKSSKLFWTAELERAALELFVQAVCNVKSSDDGFQT